MRSQFWLTMILGMVILVTGFLAGLQWGSGDREVVEVPVYPCQEDEWYGYWPGHEGPVCVHRDVVEGR